MNTGARIGVVLLAAVLAAPGVAAAGQIAERPEVGTEALRQQIERRFEVLPLRNGIALRPKSARPGVRSIEVTDDAIAIDGVAATGAELRAKLGPDADLVLRVSYLDAAARRSLASPPATGEPPSVAPPPPSAPEPPPPPRRQRRSDARVRIAGPVRVDEDETVGDVVVIGGTAHVDGEVDGDLVVVGGLADLGPHAYVRKDVSIIGGTLHRAVGARVDGRVNQIGPGISLTGLHWRRTPFVTPVWPEVFGWGRAVALVATMMRFAVLAALALLVVLVGTDYVARVGRRAAEEPLKAAAVGVLAQLLFVPLLVMTVIVLVITIVGIPLLALIPFAILGLGVVLLIGFTAVAQQVGQRVAAYLGASQPGPYATALVGIVAVMSPIVLARVVGLGGGLLFPITAVLLLAGFLVEYFAWTVGLGAVALNRFDKRPAS